MAERRQKNLFLYRALTHFMVELIDVTCLFLAWFFAGVIGFGLVFTLFILSEFYLQATFGGLLAGRTIDSGYVWPQRLGVVLFRQVSDGMLFLFFLWGSGFLYVKTACCVSLRTYFDILLIGLPWCLGVSFCFVSIVLFYYKISEFFTRIFSLEYSWNKPLPKFRLMMIFSPFIFMLLCVIIPPDYVPRSPNGYLKSNMFVFKTLLETYADEHGGYPESAAVLWRDPKSQSRLKYINNIYTYKSGLGLSFSDEVLTLESIVLHRPSLPWYNYWGVPGRPEISVNENAVGLLTFATSKNHGSYVIYGYDHEGMKVRSKGGVFFLSNS